MRSPQGGLRLWGFRVVGLQRPRVGTPGSFMIFWEGLCTPLGLRFSFHTPGRSYASKKRVVPGLVLEEPLSLARAGVLNEAASRCWSARACCACCRILELRGFRPVRGLTFHASCVGQGVACMAQSAVEPIFCRFGRTSSFTRGRTPLLKMLGAAGSELQPQTRNQPPTLTPEERC